MGNRDENHKITKTNKYGHCKNPKNDCSICSRSKGGIIISCSIRNGLTLSHSKRTRTQTTTYTTRNSQTTASGIMIGTIKQRQSKVVNIIIRANR